MTRPFPTLFLTGDADFAAPYICIYKVIIGAYFKCLMMYKDSCFAKHPCTPLLVCFGSFIIIHHPIASKPNMDSSSVDLDIPNPSNRLQL